MTAQRSRAGGAAVALLLLATACSSGPPEHHATALKQVRAIAMVLAEGKPDASDPVGTNWFLGACADLGHLADGTEPGLSSGDRKRLQKVVPSCHLDPAASLRVSREILDD